MIKAYALFVTFRLISAQIPGLRYNLTCNPQYNYWAYSKMYFFGKIIV